jgi:hypothetical protein
MQFSENVQANWQEGYCLREFKDYSGNFLNIRLTARTWPLVSSICFSLLGGIRFADDEEVETEVRKWPRQQSKDNCAAGFDARVKRWDTCIDVGGGYVEK